MNDTVRIRRSLLHALEPIAVGTPDAESLLSYIYRLAMSHCVSVRELINRVTERMGWEQRARYSVQWHNFNPHSTGEVAEKWSSGLSALTSVERLDKLTLLPWRKVISQQGLTAKPSRWCSQCFAQDRSDGRDPYFRLAWDLGDVDVCPRHATRLTDVCPDCGRTNVRNTMTYVVPGWCSSCGAFLGDAKDLTLANSADVWKSSQIGSMLATHARLHSALGPEPMISGIVRLVSNLDGGNNAAFARRIGLAKTTVHYWLQQGGIPSMAGHLRIASQTGVTLVELLTGQVGDEPRTSAEIPALATLFPDRKQRASPRTHNVEQINMQLKALIRSNVPVSAAEAARRLNVHHRQLYVFADQAARSLSHKWTQHRQHRGIESAERARKLIEPALKAIAAEGKSANLRLLMHRIPVGTPGILKHAIALIKEAKLSTGSDEQIHSED